MSLYGFLIYYQVNLSWRRRFLIRKSIRCSAGDGEEVQALQGLRRRSFCSRRRICRFLYARVYSRAESFEGFAQFSSKFLAFKIETASSGENCFMYRRNCFIINRFPMYSQRMAHLEFSVHPVVASQDCL